MRVIYEELTKEDLLRIVQHFEGCRFFIEEEWKAATILDYVKYGKSYFFLVSVTSGGIYTVADKYIKGQFQAKEPIYQLSW